MTNDSSEGDEDEEVKGMVVVRVEGKEEGGEGVREEEEEEVEQDNEEEEGVAEEEMVFKLLPLHTAVVTIAALVSNKSLLLTLLPLPLLL